MTARLLALVFCGYWFASAPVFAATLWEMYVAQPSPQNARPITAIQYSEPLPEPEQGERATTDIQMLAVQVYSGDREAFRLTLRLISSTAAGANLEDLYEIAGRFLRQNPKAFLEGIATAGLAKHCPGATFVGPQYVDREEARAYELKARREALLSVRTKNLIPVRSSCLGQFKHDR